MFAWDILEEYRRECEELRGEQYQTSIDLFKKCAPAASKSFDIYDSKMGLRMISVRSHPPGKFVTEYNSSLGMREGVVALMENYYLAQTGAAGGWIRHPVIYSGHEPHGDRCGVCAYAAQLSSLPILNGGKIDVRDGHIFISTGWERRHISHKNIPADGSIPCDTSNSVLMRIEYLRGIGCELIGYGDGWMIIEPMVMDLSDLGNLSKPNYDTIIAHIIWAVAVRRIIIATLPQPIAEELFANM
jgi:hypothetical protein